MPAGFLSQRPQRYPLVSPRHSPTPRPLDESEYSLRWQVRLETLARLRWLAVLGQIIAVLAVDLGLGFPLPLLPCLALIGLSVLLNILLKLRYPASQRLTEEWTAWLLAYDIAQLGGLLFLTGGLTNPFSILLIAPVTVSAAALSPRPTLLLAAFAIGVTSFLTMVHLPLPWSPVDGIDPPKLLTIGNWIALVLSLGFIAVYTFRIAEEGRQLDEALAATELVLEREQHLSALDGLAAATAHELGTPLATIVLTAKELSRESFSDPDVADDIALIRSQAERCREILTRLSSLSADPEEHMGRMPLSQLIEEVVAPHREFGISIFISLAGDDSEEPVGSRNPGILYGLGNIVENAVDYADEAVTIEASWTGDDITIVVTDDGPGFAPGVLDRLGDPYVTTRPRSVDHERTAGDGNSGGLGLGLFIAKSLLERSGAKVEWRNRGGGLRGAVSVVRWPRAAMERTSEGWDVRRRLFRSENTDVGTDPHAPEGA